MFKKTQLVLVVSLFVSQALFAQTGEKDCKDARSTNLISTSAHVINGMIMWKTSGQRGYIDKYLKQVVYLSSVFPDAIIESETKIGMVEKSTFESGSYTIVYLFSKDYAEIVEILNDQESKFKDRSFAIKGTGYYADDSDPGSRTFYFTNCCLIDEGDRMLETLNVNFVPVETMLDLPGGPWNKDK